MHNMNEGGPDAARFDALYNDINSEDINKIKTTITLLNTELCMANESMKNVIKPDRFIKLLVNYLDNQHDPSLMVQSSNCLLTMLDLFPEASETIIDYEGLRVLESKGKSIEYIDVAEDCIKLLNKIAETCPNEILSSNSALNYLNVIDFFDKHVQDVIMDLVKKLFNIGVWNKNIKEHAAIVVNKCACINLEDESSSIKPLETFATLLQ